MQSPKKKASFKLRKLPLWHLNYPKLFSCLLISLLFFALFASPDFASDTYVVLKGSSQEILANFIQSGRFITAFFFAAFRFLRAPFSLSYLVSYFAAIAFAGLTIYLMDEILHELGVKRKLLRLLCASLVVISPYMLELFMYIEKGVMIFGLFTAVLGAYFFMHFIEAKNLKLGLLCLASVLLSAFSYQGTVGVFILLASMITLLKSQKLKTFVVNTAYSLLFYALPSFLNVLCIKLLSSSGRVSGEIVLSESLIAIAHGAKKLFKLFEMVPVGLFYGIFVVMLIWAGYKFFEGCQKQALKHYGIFLLCISYLIAVSLLAALAPQILQNTSSIWIVARSTVSYSAVFGVIASCCLLLQEHFEPLDDQAKESYELVSTTAKSKVKLISHKVQQGSGLLCLLLAGALLLEYFSFGHIIKDHYAVNEIDKHRAIEISDQISRYEEHKGVDINAISPTPSSNAKRMAYPELYVHEDINISAFSTTWSDVNIIKLYSGQDFERVEANDEDRADCAGKHDDSIVFKENRAVICLY